MSEKNISIMQNNVFFGKSEEKTKQFLKFMNLPNKITLLKTGTHKHKHTNRKRNYSIDVELKMAQN